MTSEEATMLRCGAIELGIELSGEEIDRFALFTRELLRWNAKLNLTALEKVTDIVAKHYLDSLSISSLLPCGAILLDIGSGGGFPSIPLKIIRPDIVAISVDSVQKKINFQRHVARSLRLEKFRAVHSRIEDLDQGLAGGVDFVVARAVADLMVLAQMGARFLTQDGKLIAMKGSRWREEMAESAGRLDGLGLVVTDTIELRLPVTGDVRGVILIGRKK